MNRKYATIGLLSVLFLIISTPTIASVYEDFPLTQGQIKFIKLFDSKAGTKFSELIDTPNANRIISAATFACTHTDFQEKVVIAAGGDLKTAKEASKIFESLFCDHVNPRHY